MRRTPFPPRSVPLLRTTGLERNTALRETGFPPVGRQVPRPARLALVDGAGAPVVPISQRRRKNTPTDDTRKRVLLRDGFACVCCGQSIIGQRYSLGHRLRASQGGKVEPSNLLVFLGWGGEACHGRIDSRREPRDEEKGLTVRSWQDPALIPVTLFDGRQVWLTPDGHYADESPEGAA